MKLKLIYEKVKPFLAEIFPDGYQEDDFDMDLNFFMKHPKAREWKEDDWANIIIHHWTDEITEKVYNKKKVKKVN